jgi:hypothetical protein
MNSHNPSAANSLFSYKYRSQIRRTTSNIIGTESILSLHKTSNSIGSHAQDYEIEIEKIKLEIRERLKEQQKREEFLKNILQIENDPGNTELYTETTRKSELKNSEAHLNESKSFFFCFKKLFSKCFWC